MTLSPSGRWPAPWKAMLVIIGSLVLTVVLLGINAAIERPRTTGGSAVTFSGSGEMDTAPQHLSGGDYDVRWFVWPNRFYLTCAFVVRLGRANVGPPMDLANVELRNAPMAGATRVNAVAPGEYVGHAMSTCGEWKVELTSR